MKNKTFNLFEKNRAEASKAAKYSELLEQFMTPFTKELETFDDYEKIIDFSIYAWNLGNIRQPMSEDSDIEDTNLYSEEDIINAELLNKMIAYKISHFNDYSYFIVDFVIEGTDETPVLTLITQEREVYIKSILDEFEDEFDFDDNEESFINRNAVIIKPRQAFIDWLNVVYMEYKHEMDDFLEPSIYLVNDDDDDEFDDTYDWLKKNFDKLFVLELEGWSTDEKEWPQKRTYKMFTEWFQVDISTSIYDTAEEPVVKY